MIFLLCIFSILQAPSHFNVTRHQVALDGYDPVSYFSGDGPKRGTEDNSFTYKGVKYLFSTDANRQSFRSDPKNYLPQYGGWCAYAMGESGEKVKVDPETFKIMDGKLYLFYNFWGNNTLKTWNNDEYRLKTTADTNWDRIIKS